MDDRFISAEAMTKRLLAEIDTGVADDAISPELKKSRETNSKLQFQLGILERSVARETGGPAAAPAQPKKAVIPAAVQQDPTKAFDFVKELNSVFAIAIATVFPGIECEPKIAPNSAKPAKKGGKKGKGKKGDAAPKVEEKATYQCNAPMRIFQMAKAAGETQYKSPRDVAVALVAAIPPSPLLSRCEAGGPGFINIYLAKAFVSDKLAQLLKDGVKAGSITPKKTTVDFSSPNVAKEMHVGHLRSTIIGESICRLLEFAGHDVKRVNHVGDWGTQFGMLTAHLADRFPNYLTETPPIGDLQSFYKESKVRFDEDAEFKARAYSCVGKLQGGQDKDITKAWTQICDVSRAEFQKIYERLDASLEEKGESFYQSRMVQLIKDLDGSDHLSPCPDGTPRKLMWTRDPEKEGNIPLTIQKSDGAFTYDTSDLATLRYRVEEEDNDWIIYVVDSGQSTHLQLCFEAAAKCGFMDPSKGEDKKRFKTRSGDTVRLRDLLDEGLVRSAQFRADKAAERAERGQEAPELTEAEQRAANEAIAYSCIKYADLSQNRVRDYVFSYEKMLNEKGDTAIYLINAYARCKQVSAQAEVVALAAGARDGVAVVPDDALEGHWKLAQHLIRFPTVVDAALEDLLPSYLCEYCYQTASLYHEFYGDCRIISRPKDGPATVDVSRLLVTEATAKVLETCFQLIGLRFVDKM